MAGALVFLFAFPKGAITTLMHEVLHLPGPGAGIAVVVGPFVVVVALIASLLFQGTGGALVASFAFAVTNALTVWLLEIPNNPKGAFGSVLFVVALVVVGIAVEGVMLTGKALRKLWRCMLSGAAANSVLLVFYWTAVFPRTYRWVNWKDIPLLVGLCLICGLASGCIALGVSRAISQTAILKEKE